MDRSEARRAYKENPPAAGVYSLHHLASGTRLVASSPNVSGALNRHRFSLRMGNHRNRRLQRDYDAGGAEGFAFEVLEEVDRNDPAITDVAGELEVLEALWHERLALNEDQNYRSFGPVV